MYRVEMIICGAYSSLGASYLSPVLYDCSPVQEPSSYVTPGGSYKPGKERTR